MSAEIFYISEWSYLKHSDRDIDTLFMAYPRYKRSIDLDDATGIASDAFESMLCASEASGPERSVDMHARRFGVALAMGAALGPAELIEIGCRYVRSLHPHSWLSDADQRHQLHRLLLGQDLHRITLIGPSCANEAARRHVVGMLRRTIEELDDASR